MTNAILHLDGSMGEGGGQILRTGLTLSMVTGQPFRIDRIRANRPKPGLMRQHLTAVQAAAQVCDGTVTGASVGSEALTFHPGAVRHGDFAFSIGTAGSTTLVLQTILPALVIAGGPTRITIDGGTHNLAAPTVHFLNRAFVPLVERMGPRVTVALEKHGFYPAGGGRIAVDIQPVSTLEPIEILHRGEITHRKAIATIAGLSRDIAARELASIASRLGWEGDRLEVEQLPDRAGPGNVVSIEIGTDSMTEVFTGFGRRGVSAEQVGSAVAGEARDYLSSTVPAWHYLADQLMVPMSIAGAGAIRTCTLSSHGRTNLEVIRRFLPVRIDTRHEPDGVEVVEFRSD
jgi:RNA 3'-terminal phosphate cyclase (ATP)